jgi:mannosyltransferase
MHCALLMVTVALAAALCFHDIGGKSIWLDEGFSIALAGDDWPQMWNVIRTRDPNMGFYYVLLHYWLRLGSDEATIRAFSALAALGSVVLLYFLGRDLIGSLPALLAALLLTTNGFFIRYAQEARSYALLVLLITASSHLFVRAVSRPSAKLWAAYVVVSALSLYTHFFAGWVLAAHFLSATVLRGRLVPRRDILASYLLLALAASPLVVWTLTTDRRLFWIPLPTWRSLLRALEELTGGAGAVQVALFLSLSGLALRTAWQARATKSGVLAWNRGLLLTWFLVPILTSFILSLLVTPIFWPRFLIVSLPPLVLLTADGAFAVRPVWLRAVTAVLLLGLSTRGIAAGFRSDTNEDWRGAARYVSSAAEPGDGLVLMPGNARSVFEYYLRRFDPEPRVLEPVFPPLPWGAYDILSPEVYRPPSEWLAERSLKQRRIWVVEWQSGDTNGVVERLPDRFLERYQEEDARTLNRMRVRVFQGRSYDRSPQQGDHSH